eukprot:5033827-Pyramimonas_sp.AAC.1
MPPMSPGPQGVQHPATVQLKESQDGGDDKDGQSLLNLARAEANSPGTKQWGMILKKEDTLVLDFNIRWMYVLIPLRRS